MVTPLWRSGARLPQGPCWGCVVEVNIGSSQHTRRRQCRGQRHGHRSAGVDRHGETADHTEARAAFEAFLTHFG